MGKISEFLTSDKLDKFRARFWSKVEIKGEDECWPWLAGSKRGYGQVDLPRLCGIKFKAIATRVAYFLYYGVDPGDKVVMHKCDNPPCCNPTHFELGTQKENMTDKKNKGRGYSAENHEHHACKLSPKHVMKIREMLAAKKSYREIASVFGVSRSAVSNIKHRKTWNHVK